MPARKSEVVIKQPRELLGYPPPPGAPSKDSPPPPGAPPGGEWEGERHCGKHTWIIGVCLHCWCIACCPVDTRMVYFAEGKKYSRTGVVKFDAGIYDSDDD
ncbi:unnamed protein product [Ectocarpus sp. 12 AP-2014]